MYVYIYDISSLRVNRKPVRQMFAYTDSAVGFIQAHLA